MTHDSSFLLQQSIASLFPKKQIKKEHGVTELCGSIDAIGLYSKIQSFDKTIYHMLPFDYFSLRFLLLSLVHN